MQVLSEPLSPMLANLFQGEVDKKLEKRGHAFARYAGSICGSRLSG